MLHKIRDKTTNFFSWSILILIALYSYFSSTYLSSFAELHITIPKINLPVFAGEILLSLVALLAGLVFFLKKDKINLVQLIKKYWFIAVFFIFIIIKAFLGLYRHGFLAFRNAAMFYYLFFAFATYHFYRQESFKPALRYILLIILAVAALIFRPIAYFLYTYYVFMLILILKERGWRKIAGFTLFFIVLLRNENFFVQSKAALISLGVVLMYLISNFIIYLYGRVKSKKPRLLIMMTSVVALIFVFSFILNGPLRAKAGSFSEYLNKYNEIEKKVDSALKENSYPAKKMKKAGLFQSNKYMYEQLIKNIYSESELFENKKNNKDDEIKFKEGKDVLNDEQKKMLYIEMYNLLLKNTKHILGGNFEKERIQALERITIAIIGGMWMVIRPIQIETYKLTCEAARLGKPEIKIEDRYTYALKRLKETWVENTREYVKIILRQSLPSDVSPDILKALEEEIEISIKDIILKNAQDIARDIVYGVPRSSMGDFYNIMWRVFVWKDMLEEVAKDKKTLLLGMDFGYPFRSKSAEIMNWSDGGWIGWLEPHNSYIHIFYRAGIAGIALIVVILGLFIKMALYFTINKNITGIMLTSALLYWLCLSCFMVVLEMPYYAIPFWSLFGATLEHKRLSGRNQCR